MLHRGIHIQDFRVPEKPVAPQASLAVGLKRLCRDGFNDMETVSTGKSWGVKRRKQNHSVPRMGQLPLAEGPKPGKRKAKAPHKVLDIDPSLWSSSSKVLAEPHFEMTVPDSSLPVYETAPDAYWDNDTIAISCSQTASLMIPESRLGQDNSATHVFRRRRSYRQRDPLAFGRTVTGDLMMVRATRSVDGACEDSDDATSSISSATGSSQSDSEATKSDNGDSEEDEEQESNTSPTMILPSSFASKPSGSESIQDNGSLSDLNGRSLQERHLITLKAHASEVAEELEHMGTKKGPETIRVCDRRPLGLTNQLGGKVFHSDCRSRPFAESQVNGNSARSASYGGTPCLDSLLKGGRERRRSKTVGA